MTKVPRLDATLCFVNEDRIELDPVAKGENDKEEKELKKNNVHMKNIDDEG